MVKVDEHRKSENKSNKHQLGISKMFFMIACGSENSNH